MENIPQFIDKNNLILLIITTNKLLAKHEEMGQKDARICTKLTSIHEKIIEKIEHRVIVDAISQVSETIFISILLIIS